MSAACFLVVLLDYSSDTTLRFRGKIEVVSDAMNQKKPMDRLPRPQS